MPSSPHNMPNFTSDISVFRLAIGMVSNRIEITESGLYCLTSDVDCWVLIGDSAVTADSTKFPLWAKTRECVPIEKGQWLAAVTTALSGTLHIAQDAAGYSG